MKFQDFMNKVRQWDHKNNQWFFRHFYVLFFEIILVVAFIIFFTNTVGVINLSSDIDRKSVLEKLLLSQNTQGGLIVFLLLLNSFWMLFMFSSLLKIRAVLKNIDFHLSRRANERYNDDN
ncbi:MAG: hypothetical protein HQL16_04410 [Candidatus Omnitrophica bacterium]|nr:hypothetical protein [Candidatus Omnitrophota bacterium]